MLVKSGIRVNLSVPQHRELSIGTLRSLIRHAGLTIDEFLDRCKQLLQCFSHVGGWFRDNPNEGRDS